MIGTPAHIRESAEDAGITSRTPRVARWLHFAAAPAFGLMALWTGLAVGAQAGMACPATHGMPPLAGMTPMYVLMAVFHATPWIKAGCCLVAQWRSAPVHVQPRRKLRALP